MINFALSNGTFVYFDNRTGRLGLSYKPVENVFEFEERFKTDLLNFAQKRKVTRNFHVFLQTTLACHLACKGCFEEEAREVGQSDLKKQEFSVLKKVEEYIESVCLERGLKPNQVTLVVFGGEPLTAGNFELIQRYFEFASKKGYWVSVVSSLADLSEKYLDLFVRYKDLVCEVDVTLEGLAEIHDQRRPFRNGGGTFFRVVKNLKRLLDKGIPVLCKTNIGTSNVTQIPELLEYLETENFFSTRNFVYGVNMIRDFGSAKSDGEVLGEAMVASQLVKVFSKKQHLLPQVRIEGLKLTRYISAALELFYSKGHRNENLLDLYPSTGFCNPSDGTSVTFDPTGRLLECNWMSAKPEYFESKRVKVLPVVSRSICDTCSINTLCGGGCLVDREAKTTYLKGKCFNSFSEEIHLFLEKLLELDLLPKEECEIASGFDLDYKYEHRSTW